MRIHLTEVSKVTSSLHAERDYRVIQGACTKGQASEAKQQKNHSKKLMSYESWQKNPWRIATTVAQVWGRSAGKGTARHYLSANFSPS